jgi:hypothetical protein
MRSDRLSRGLHGLRSSCGLQPASRAPGCAGGGRDAGVFVRPHRRELEPRCARQSFVSPHPPLRGGFERPSNIMLPVIRNRRSPESLPTGRTRRLRITRTMCQWPLPRPAAAVKEWRCAPRCSSPPGRSAPGGCGPLRRPPRRPSAALLPARREDEDEDEECLRSKLLCLLALISLAPCSPGQGPLRLNP